MSLRDWLAGQALSGLIAAKATVGDKNVYNGDLVTIMAYQFADAMLQARESSND